jgi:opacity protein-like surface antigen
MHSRKASIAGAICTIVLSIGFQWCDAQNADSWSPSPESFVVEDLFASGRYEAGITTGLMFSPVGNPRNRPEINYTTTALQVGRMIGGVHGRGPWRGSLELGLEAFGNAIYEGPGSYIAGAAFRVRYNFVPRGWRLIPFVEGAAGLLSTDIDRGLVGQPFNFDLEVGVGARYFIARDWSVSLAYRFQHISNADLGKTNIGLNGQGAILGISHFF